MTPNEYPPVADNAAAPNPSDYGQPPVGAPGAEQAPSPDPHAGVELWPTAATAPTGAAAAYSAAAVSGQDAHGYGGNGGPVVPVMDQSQGIMAIPKADAMSPHYAKAGRMGGWALAALTVGVLIFAIVVAGLEYANSKSNSSSASGGVSAGAQQDAATGSGGTDGTLDYDTAGSTSGGLSAPAAGAAATGSKGSTSGSSTAGSSSSGGSASSGSESSGGGGGGGAGTGGGGGVAIKRPPDGSWSASGDGSWFLNTSTIDSGGNALGLSMSVTASGDCWDLTWVGNSNNRWAANKFCPTSDGGLVVPKTFTYNVISLGALGTLYNRSTTTCDSPMVYLSGSPQAGESLSAPSCVATNEICNSADFSSCTPSPQLPVPSVTATTISVVGLENVGGQDAWHVRMQQELTPQNDNANGWTKTREEGNSEDWWFRTSDGLPLRMDRSTKTVSLPAGNLSVLGPSNFTENWSLTISP